MEDNLAVSGEMFLEDGWWGIAGYGRDNRFRRMASGADLMDLPCPFRIEGG